MRYLHTMVRVRNLDAALKFYQDALGLKEVRRIDSEKGKFTLVFLCAPEDDSAAEGRAADARRRWSSSPITGTRRIRRGRNFGHIAYEVDDIYAYCDNRKKAASPSTGRRATATWLSSARRTSISIGVTCRRATPSRRPSPGRACRIPAIGELNRSLRTAGQP